MFLKRNVGHPIPSMCIGQPCMIQEENDEKNLKDREMQMIELDLKTSDSLVNTKLRL